MKKAPLCQYREPCLKGSGIIGRHIFAPGGFFPLFMLITLHLVVPEKMVKALLLLNFLTKRLKKYLQRKSKEGLSNLVNIPVFLGSTTLGVKILKQNIPSGFDKINHG